MSTPLNSLEEIHAALILLRQDNATRRKFPKELWDSIIRLTKVHSIEEICQRLQISPVYLKHKIRQKSTSLDFHEISMPLINPDVIIIELDSKIGLKARIQGPSSCLIHLKSLFGG